MKHRKKGKYQKHLQFYSQSLLHKLLFPSGPLGPLVLPVQKLVRFCKSVFSNHCWATYAEKYAVFFMSILMFWPVLDWNRSFHSLWFYFHSVHGDSGSHHVCFQPLHPVLHLWSVRPDLLATSSNPTVNPVRRRLTQTEKHRQQRRTTARKPFTSQRWRRLRIEMEGAIISFICFSESELQLFPLRII